ncbi:MAG: type II toxin-antitoxin system HicB family antitoxin [Thermotogota bacterium]|nr:type II toxin-antitoxin system HicB family antitoxin [Thermotogota bacterium]
MKKRYAYVAKFLYEDNGTISVFFPDLPGCYSAAESLEETIKNAKEAMGLHLYCMEKDGEEIPAASSLRDIKLEKNEAAHVIDIFMPPMRERIKNRFVKKTLSLPAWLADKADEAGVNFSKIFQNALMDYLDVSQQDKQQNIRQ